MPQVGALKIKLQLFSEGDTAFGPGKAELLEAIAREGSIAAGGRAMGMSYRRAWLLVDTMNRCWSEPLVKATAGGGAQRGAQLTECGLRVLAAFRALEAELAGAAGASAATAVLTSLIRDHPIAPARDHDELTP